MLGDFALAQPTLAAAIPGPAVALAEERFDVSQTIISQYANSPVILAMADYFSQWFDGAALFNLFFTLVWDVDTAEGYGLDVLGRIVGASRIVNVPTGGTYIGFAGQPTAENWGNGIWYRGTVATNNIRLTDETYRRVVKAKAMANVWDGTIPGVNAILMALFPGYGNCYMADSGGMQIVYHFGAALSPVDYAIASQEGILPRPSGVSATIVQG